jgi:hypothetical protein
MKKTFMPLAAALSTMLLLTGCLAVQIGGGDKSEGKNPTIGQQLIDLQKAKDAGVITDTEYQAQKAKLLEHK